MIVWEEFHRGYLIQGGEAIPFKVFEDGMVVFGQVGDDVLASLMNSRPESLA